MRHTGRHDILETLGRRIRTTRMSHGLSQAALAEMCGITFQQVQKYERGTTRIPVDRLVVVAGALEVPLTELVADLDRGIESYPEAPRRRSHKQAVALLKHFNAIEDERVRGWLLGLIKAVSRQRRTAAAPADGHARVDPAPGGPDATGPDATGDEDRPADPVPTAAML